MRHIIIMLLITNLISCASYDFSRRLVQQGNLLPQTKINQLHVGMNKTEVANLMGTSLITPMFNEDRWDYAFTERRGSGALICRNLRLYFLHDHLVRILQH